MYTLYCSKERFSFKAAHFAIFSEYHAERLHGHNYYVDFEIESRELDSKLGLIIEFNELKPFLYESVKELDEYVLIPELSSYLRVSKKNNSVEIQFANKTYLLPSEDVRLVPVVNISCEAMAFYFWKKVSPALSRKYNICGLKVTVEETRGQKASYYHAVEKALR